MKFLLNKIKSEKKKRNKNLDKIKELKKLLVRIKYVNNPNKLQSALKEINKIQVIDKNLHEIKQETLQYYNGEFEMVGNLKVDDQIRQTHIRFRNMDDFESIETLSMKDMMLTIAFSMVIFKNSTLHNLIKSIDLNTEKGVVLIK